MFKAKIKYHHYSLNVEGQSTGEKHPNTSQVAGTPHSITRKEGRTKMLVKKSKEVMQLREQ